MAIPLFSMTRTLARMGSSAVGIGPTTDREICIEQAISLAGRLAARLIHARLSVSDLEIMLILMLDTNGLQRVSQFFMAGKYSIFQDISKSTSSPSRKYHALFLSVLIERGVSEFKVRSVTCFYRAVANYVQDLGATTLDLFLLELVKPFSFLAYENRLALAIKHCGDLYLKDAIVEAGNSPDYYSNRDLFSRKYIVLGLKYSFTNIW